MKTIAQVFVFVWMRFRLGSSNKVTKHGINCYRNKGGKDRRKRRATITMTTTTTTLAAAAAVAAKEFD